MGRNTADDNAAFTRLAERLIQQQDAALSNPATIQATIPEQGRLVTFSRTVAVDHWADLQIDVKAKAVSTAGWFTRLLILAGTALGLGAFVWSTGNFRRAQTA
jgi:CRISPR/Cas system-associated exonuclease Cas4 (RecB family)